MRVDTQSGKRANPTLFDRFAVAFLSGMTAFITGLLVLVVLVTKDIERISAEIFLFRELYWFIGIMMLIGFFSLENIMARIYGLIWKGICYLFSLY